MDVASRIQGLEGYFSGRVVDLESIRVLGYVCRKNVVGECRFYSVIRMYSIAAD
jgi:hypothetical protein